MGWKDVFGLFKEVIDMSRYPFAAFFPWRSVTAYLATRIVLPVEQIIFFYLLGLYGNASTPLDYYVIGNSVFMVTFGGVYAMSLSIDREKQSGTLVYILGTPRNHLYIFWSRSLFFIIDGMMGAVTGLALGLLFRVDFANTNFLLLLLALAVTSASSAAMGFALGSLSLRYLDALVLNNIFYFILLTLSGANIPLQRFPPAVQTISLILPLTRGIEAVRGAVSGAQIDQVLLLVGGEIAVAAVYGLIGCLFFAYLELRALRQGTIEYF